MRSVVANKLEIFLVALRLGLTSFGGPAAHLGYFRDEYVVKRQWISEKDYTEIIALCQFLPGPASSQVGIAVGMNRGGIIGGFLAWLGFTLPSAMILGAFAYGILTFEDVGSLGWFKGLKIVAVPVVGVAIYGMFGRFCIDWPRRGIAIIATSVVLVIGIANSQVYVIICAGLLGLVIPLPAVQITSEEKKPVVIGYIIPTISLVVFGVILFIFSNPAITQLFDNEYFSLAENFYRVGSLVFGGGHVVLPLLHDTTVVTGWVTEDQFVAGYGLAQAIPGPLFTFAAYLGVLIDQPLGPWVGGMVAIVAIFLPSFFLVAGVLPFWNRVRDVKMMQRSVSGVNAAVVGLLIAAFYNPIWTSTIHKPEDLLLCGFSLGAMVVLKWPTWLVVILTAGLGQGMTYFI